MTPQLKLKIFNILKQHLTTPEQKEAFKALQRGLKKEVGNNNPKGATSFMEAFNKLYGTKFKVTSQIRSSFNFWNKSYPTQDIIKAVNNSKKHEWLKKIKLTPIIFLRQKDSHGNPCDRIGDCLQISTFSPAKTKALHSLPEISDEDRERNMTRMQEMKEKFLNKHKV